MIHPEDLRPGLFVAVRFMREHPEDNVWDHVASPAIYRVLNVAFPYVAVECLSTGRRLPMDVAAYEFEQLRPEFVAALFPDQETPVTIKPRSSKSHEDLDEQGFRKPVRLMTIK